MAAPQLKKVQGNSASTTLSSGVSNSATSASLTSDTNFQGEGMVVLSESENVEEYAYATTKGGGALTIPLANRGLEGGSAQTHASGATVKGILTAGMWNDLIDHVATEHNDDGTHKPPVIYDTNGNEQIKLTATASAVNELTITNAATTTSPSITATGGDTNIDVKIAGKGTGHLQAYDNTSASYFDVVPNSSMARQAIMNGNFDVWQRGTSTTLSDATITRLADRWFDYAADDGGTLPTLTRTRQSLTAGELSNAFYFTRLNTNGAGTSLGNSSIGTMGQRIEFGTRFLCGNGKKVTISFWARSDIANKKIWPVLIQNYGTTGSPTSQEYIAGTSITLTSTLTQYTQTFTTNTLSGKTFGTSNNDYLALELVYQWGSTTASSYGLSGTETYVGSGNIDIAQVQLCAGEVALPFQPKSYAQELADCQRYYWRLDGTDNSPITVTTNHASNAAFGCLHLPTRMRSTAPAISFANAGDFQILVNANDVAVSDLVAYETQGGETNIVGISITSSGLTIGQAGLFRFNGDSKYLAFSAEL